MKKTGQVFFWDESDELYLAESYEDDIFVVTTTQTKIETTNEENSE